MNITRDGGVYSIHCSAVEAETLLCRARFLHVGNYNVPNNSNSRPLFGIGKCLVQLEKLRRINGSQNKDGARSRERGGGMSTPLDLDALERTVRKTSTATGQWRRIYANDVPSLIAEIRDLRRRVAVYDKAAGLGEAQGLDLLSLLGLIKDARNVIATLHWQLTFMTANDEAMKPDKAAQREAQPVTPAEDIQKGWVELCADSKYEHYVTLINCNGQSLCRQFNASGLYAPTSYPCSLDPCPACLSIVNMCPDCDGTGKLEIPMQKLSRASIIKECQKCSGNGTREALK